MLIMFLYIKTKKQRPRALPITLLYIKKMIKQLQYCLFKSNFDVGQNHNLRLQVKDMFREHNSVTRSQPLELSLQKWHNKEL